MDCAFSDSSLSKVSPIIKICLRCPRWHSKTLVLLSSTNSKYNSSVKMCMWTGSYDGENSGSVVDGKIDTFWTVQYLTSFIRFFKPFFLFNLKSWSAVEISDQKILIFEKFKFPTFTGKKNQAFWTRIDNFRNCFGTLAYVDVVWRVSLRN